MSNPDRISSPVNLSLGFRYRAGTVAAQMARHVDDLLGSNPPYYLVRLRILYGDNDPIKLFIGVEFQFPLDILSMSLE